jgi:hypothetical protein
MATTVKMRIQLRRDTAANWELYKDIVPATGEPCFVIDKNILKIGDGITTFENLEPIGGVKLEVATDGKSIVLEDNIFQLIGFNAAEVGAQPVKGEDGTLQWVVPSTETVEGLQITVTNLRSDVNTLQKIVGVSSGEGSITLLDRIESLETKVDDAGAEASNMASDIKTLKDLVGDTPVGDQILAIVKNSGHMTESKAKATFKHVKYEVEHKPTGTLVDYRDKEIRIMIPADTKFEPQNSGTNANPNSYYVGFKAYAPDDAVSFKEDLAEIIADNNMYIFDNNDFAGIDEYGRKYSVVWLPVAQLVDGVWTYHGAKSTKNKYIGWHYSVEWYGSDGKKIGADCIRINLTNTSCHTAIEPFYMAGVVKEVAFNGTILDVVDGKVNIVAENIVKSSDEIEVNEDGSLNIKSISFDKIKQSEDSVLVMNGGTAG